MALINLTELGEVARRGERLLGIDPGRKRIGLALSDVGRAVASPFGTIPRGKLAAIVDTLRGLAKAEHVAGMVVGLPLEMDGAFGPAAQAARDWTRDLSDALALPAVMWDERLSTAAVNRFLIDTADLGRKRRGEVVDRASAAWILQGALDALRAGTTSFT